MKYVLLSAVLGVTVHLSAAAQSAQRPSTDKVGEAYTQFVLGHHLEESDDINGAIAAYKRAMELDSTAAEVPAELAALYLRQNKVQDAMAMAEQALKIAPANSEANRVLGTVYAALSETGRQNSARGREARNPDENLTKAIRHLEAALEHPVGQPDPNLRATLARLYVDSGAFDKAVPILSELVRQEPGWSDGPLLLAEAYAGAGRTKDAIEWLENHGDPRLLPTLADFYERDRRWKDAARTYERALQRAPRNLDLKTRYATALLNGGERDDFLKARDLLTEVVAARPAPDPRTLYLLAQSQRRVGDYGAAEATARRIVALNQRSPWGYYALAEALEQAHKYEEIIGELAPVVAEARGNSSDPSFDIGLLLPHLGFAYQELGQHDKAIAAFEEAHRLVPRDAAIAGYLVEANIAAKKYSAAVDVARDALAQQPDNLRLMRLQAQALRYAGKPDQGVALLEDAVKKHGDDPAAYIALAQLYSDIERGPQAIRVLQGAQAKFPSDTSIVFELGAAYDKQKNFPQAEAAFKDVIAKDPENSAALNYLGYMLAERGERLDESVTLVKKALQLEPDNPSYLDSLGWAYFKAEKLDVAETNLKRAAEQLKANSVIQDHYGEVLFRLGRYDEAIAAWTRALNGDGESVNKGDIDKKIKTARQKLEKK